VVRVPECLERLLPDTMVCRRVHDEHTEQHHMACDSTGLKVVNLKSGDGTNLRLLNVVKATSGSQPDSFLCWSSGLPTEASAPLGVAIESPSMNSLHIVRCGVNDSEQEGSIGELSMHPYVLVKRNERDLGPDKPHGSPADRE
jgi:hypothetical protein